MALKTILTLLALLLLIACDVPQNTQIKLTFWHTLEDAENIALLRQLIDKFESKNPNVAIELVKVSDPHGMDNKIRKALSYNTAPDFVWWGPQQLGYMRSTGRLLKFGKWIKTDTSFQKDTVYDVLWKTASYNGEIYAVPFDTNNLALYYNRDLFKKQNIDPNTINTWQDLLHAAKQLTQDFDNDGLIDQYGLQLPTGEDEWTVWVWQTQLWASGGTFLTADHEKVAFNSAMGIQALQWWLDLIYTHKVAILSGKNRGYKIEDFLAGKIAMVINGPWNFKKLEKAKAKGLHYGAIKLPKAQRYVTNIGGENLYALKTFPAHEKAQWQFAKYVLSKEFQMTWAMKTGYLPVNKEVSEDPIYKAFVAKNPFIKTYLEQIPYGRYRPAIQAYPRISKILAEKLHQALVKEITPVEALSQAAVIAQKELSFWSHFLKDNFSPF